MADNNLRDIKSFYSNASKQFRELLGPRNIFDKAEYRYVLKDKHNNSYAFIEAKLIAGQTELYYNIGFKYPKYCQINILNALFSNLQCSIYIMKEYITTYGTDFHFQQLLQIIGFYPIADRNIILQKHLINDASHINFMRGH